MSQSRVAEVLAAIENLRHIVLKWPARATFATQKKTAR